MVTQKEKKHVNNKLIWQLFLNYDPNIIICFVAILSFSAWYDSAVSWDWDWTDVNEINKRMNKYPHILQLTYFLTQRNISENSPTSEEQGVYLFISVVQYYSRLWERINN